MKCIALYHVRFEDLGSFAEPLQKAGYDISYRHAGSAPLSLGEWRDTDLIVVLGGPDRRHRQRPVSVAAGRTRRTDAQAVLQAANPRHLPGRAAHGGCPRRPGGTQVRRAGKVWATAASTTSRCCSTTGARSASASPRACRCPWGD